MLDAAQALLGDGGLTAVTVDAVAARSGVAKTSIYRHWRSRSELVVALLADLVPRVQPTDVSAPLREELTRFLTAVAEQLDSGPWAAALPSLIEAADHDSELAGVRRQLAEQVQQPLLELLNAHTAQLQPMTVSDAAAQLLGPLLQRRLIHAHPIDQPLITRSVTCFLAGCGRPAAQSGHLSQGA